MTGFVLSVILTAIPFWLVMGKVFDKPGTTAFVILAFAAVQIVVHMIYFLHMNAKSEGGWNMLALIFTIVLVVITLSGSLWVMFHLNQQHDAGIHARDAQHALSRTLPDTTRGPRSTPALALLALAGVLLFALFAALGAWQVERRAWKLALDRTRRGARACHARRCARARAMAARQRGRRRIPACAARGRFLHERETLVQASTELGPGYWVLTPLRTAQGPVVLVNRGFVPPERRERATRSGNEPAGEVRRHRPAAHQRARRRLPAPQRSRGRSLVLARRAGHRRRARAGGRRALLRGRGRRRAAARRRRAALAGRRPDGDRLPNNHLVYALTWFGLALRVLLAAWLVAQRRRSRSRRRRRARDAAARLKPTPPA